MAIIFFYDDKLIMLLGSMGITRLVTNHFVSIYEIFEKLDELNEKSIFYLIMVQFLHYIAIKAFLFLVDN
ncbi:hypothetical protein GCM10022397_01750 [Flavivirga jejuensis]